MKSGWRRERTNLRAINTSLKQWHNGPIDFSKKANMEDHESKNYKKTMLCPPFFPKSLEATRPDWTGHWPPQVLSPDESMPIQGRCRWYRQCRVGCLSLEHEKDRPSPQTKGRKAILKGYETSCIEGNHSGYLSLIHIYLQLSKNRAIYNFLKSFFQSGLVNNHRLRRWLGFSPERYHQLRII